MNHESPMIPLPPPSKEVILLTVCTVYELQFAISKVVVLVLFFLVFCCRRIAAVFVC